MSRRNAKGGAARPHPRKPDAETLRRLYVDDKLNVGKIAALLHVHGGVLREWMIEYGIERRRTGPPVGWRPDKPDSKRPTPEVLKQLYWEERWSQRKIAKHFEVTQTTVQYWMRSEGIEAREPINFSDKLNAILDSQPITQATLDFGQGVEDAIPGQTRRCSRCKEIKPDSRSFYYPKGPKFPGKLSSHCIECVKADYRRRASVIAERHGEKNREKARRYNHCGAAKRAARRLKLELIAAYGGKCSCCGITEPDFLTLEHINHDARQHRESLGGNRISPNKIYKDLKRRGWPQLDYTVLCWNCNCATRFGGLCPHKRTTDHVDFQQLRSSDRAGAQGAE